MIPMIYQQSDIIYFLSSLCLIMLTITHQILGEIASNENTTMKGVTRMHIDLNRENTVGISTKVETHLYD